MQRVCVERMGIIVHVLLVSRSSDSSDVVYFFFFMYFLRRVVLIPVTLPLPLGLNLVSTLHLRLTDQPTLSAVPLIIF